MNLLSSRPNPAEKHVLEVRSEQDLGRKDVRINGFEHSLESGRSAAW